MCKRCKNPAGRAASPPPINCRLAPIVSNNLPALLIGAQGTEQAKPPPHAEMLVVQVNTVAANLRPELTPLGSLATSLLILCTLVLHH